MGLIDIKKVEEDARKELRKEQSEAAVIRIKAKLKQIASARTVVANLEHEYEVLLREVAGE